MYDYFTSFYVLVYVFFKNNLQPHLFYEINCFIRFLFVTLVHFSKKLGLVVWKLD